MNDISINCIQQSQHPQPAMALNVYLHMQGLRSQSIQELYGELEEQEEYSGEDRGAASGSCSGRSRMLLTEKLNLVGAAIRTVCAIRGLFCKFIQEGEKNAADPLHFTRCPNTSSETTVCTGLSVYTNSTP